MRSAHFFAIAATLVTFAACGMGASNSDAGSDAGLDAFVFVSCADTPPPVNVPCASPGVSCEYGTDVFPDCNHVVSCVTYAGETKWVQNAPTPPGICPTVDPGLSSACPASIAGAQGACSGSVACHYPEGFCTCAGGDGGGHWVCDTAGCPEPRPALGSSCTAEGQRCNYLECLVLWGSAQICTQGTWRTDEQAGCAQ